VGERDAHAKKDNPPGRSSPGEDREGIPQKRESLPIFGICEHKYPHSHIQYLSTKSMKG
jgi:hypothetical protein